jgi:hypothetical protein
LQFYVLAPGARIVEEGLCNSLAMTAINNHDLVVRNTSGAAIVSTHIADYGILPGMLFHNERARHIVPTIIIV